MSHSKHLTTEYSINTKFIRKVTDEKRLEASPLYRFIAAITNATVMLVDNDWIFYSHEVQMLKYDLPNLTSPNLRK